MSANFDVADVNGSLKISLRNSAVTRPDLVHFRCARDPGHRKTTSKGAAASAQLKHQLSEMLNE